MKSKLPFVLAGLAGGLICFAAIRLFPETDTPAMARLQPVAVTPSYTTGPDFTAAAEKAQQIVVLIEASESAAAAQKRQRQQDPFAQLFDRFGFPGGGFGFGFGPLLRRGAGSGVIISNDGYILTNNHVVDFADEVTVQTHDGKSYPAEIIGRDPSADLAVLKINGKNFPILEIADADKAKVGEWVLAVGNPYEYLTSTVTAGIISAKGRDLNIIQGQRAIEEFIQTDAAINPGNSGGALVDTEGRLLGINTAIASETGNYAGYSFAIPANLAIRIAKDIMETGGDIERTSLGVEVFVLDENFAKEQGVDLDKGLLVDGVGEGSAAQYAGIRPRDILVEIDGQKLMTFEDLKKQIDLSKVGDVLNFKIYRNGQFINVPVRMKKGL